MRTEYYAAREDLLGAALSYCSAEKDDPTSATYDASLEMYEGMLQRAAATMVEEMKETAAVEEEICATCGWPAKRNPWGGSGRCPNKKFHGEA